MNLTEEPEIVTWPATHYVFVEAGGPFQQTAPKAWQAAHASLGALSEHNKVAGNMSLYQVKPPVYRAGFALAAAPVDLPPGLTYENFAGGKYCRFVLTGSYAQLGAATGRVFELVGKKGIAVRAGFNIENYVNNPSTTPEDQLITEILIPTV